MAYLNENAGQVVEQAMNQTRGAVEQYFGSVEKMFSSFPLSSTELTEKMKSFTEANIETAHAYVLKLSQAKDIQEIIRIQTEYMQAQFQTFGEQTKSLTEEFTKMTAGLVKNPLRNY